MGRIRDEAEIKQEGMRVLKSFDWAALVPIALVPVVLLVPVALLVPGWSTSPLAAQQDTIPGVELRLLYEAEFQPALAVQPFLGRLGGETLASRVEAIIARDLRYSDRFEVMDSLPASLIADEIDYQLWDQLGAVWLVSGSLEGAGSGFVLVLELHDVVYGEIRERGRFPVPDAGDEDFRLAVHIAADAIVEWIYNEPGMAASRIAFSRRTEDGNQDLYLIDSDGENFRRLTHYNDLTMSPSWSADGTSIAYSSRHITGLPRLYELDLETLSEKPLEAGRNGDHFTPAFSPNGRDVAFAITGGSRSGIFYYDWERQCCLTQVSGGRWDDISPTYSPDGRRIAFNSNRLGTPFPQIYVMPATGGEAELVSPYLHGREGYYTSPDWAPVGDHVAFHGRVGRRGRYNILVADVSDRGNRLRQLTWEGNNEDPSWAPDGRHLVFVGQRDWGTGLMVVDTATGTYRMLLRGLDVRVPDWSPRLGWEGL
jgi:TolB protein